MLVKCFKIFSETVNLLSCWLLNHTSWNVPTPLSSNLTVTVKPSFKHFSTGGRRRWRRGFTNPSKTWPIFLSFSLFPSASLPWNQPVPLGSEHSQCQYCDKPALWLYWSQSEDNYQCVCVCVLASDVGKNRKGQENRGHFVHALVHVFMCAGWHGRSMSLTQFVVNWFRSVEP